ncbi:MAG TPA: preprotein translocase subunit SecG [Chitinophagaceae bacterium]
MTILFVILIILASVILGFIVLVQNPKGGGLAGSFAGLSNQFMGVKQTTDVLERGTWIFAAVIGALCLASTFFIPKAGGVASPSDTNATEAPVPAGQQPNPATTVPLPGTTTPPPNN